MKALNPEVFFKKLREPLDDRFLLFRAVAAAEAGDGRQDLVNIRAGRFERTVAERVGDEALRFCDDFAPAPAVFAAAHNSASRGQHPLRR